MIGQTNTKMQNKIYYTLYKITNRINGNIYIGVHKTEDINDGYMGSGNLIIAAIKKYGLHNFDKEILFTDLGDSKSMYAKEAELVTEEFIKRKDTYNIRIGGFGGEQPEYVKKKISNTVKTYFKNLSPEGHEKLLLDRRSRKPASKETREKISKVHLGRKATKETCQNISKALTGKPMSDERKAALAASAGRARQALAKKRAMDKMIKTEADN